MNLRALTLLLLFLLMQAGTAMAGVCEPAAPGAGCEYGCCVLTSDAAESVQSSGCACMQSSQEEQVPDSMPVVPASSSRDQAPQLVWLQVALADLWVGTPERATENRVTNRHDVVEAPRAVPLQVLHCAFLI